MPTLHVRNVPEEIYERLRRRALADNRSLSAEVLALLDAATRFEPDALGALFDRIQRQRDKLQETAGEFPSSVEILRADRER